MDFKNWLQLIESERPATKFGLYPPAYSGTGLYPPCDWLPESGEAITYAPKSWLNFKVVQGVKPPKNANHDGYVYHAVQYKIPPGDEYGQ